MATVHMIVGSLVVLGYLALTILNVMAIGGRHFAWVKPLSFGVAGVLVVQYLFGFNLLGGDHDQTAWHYLIALAALIPIGFEHASANARPDPKERARLAAIANAATFVVVLVAYLIGEMGS
ncbi:MAG: hypothetical protein ACRDJW_22485 [Thermomicrobiales bacterium]